MIPVTKPRNKNSIKNKSGLLKNLSEHPSTKNLTYAQLSAFLGILICIVLIPSGLSANDGISFYGGFLKTAVPYVGGLVLSAYYTVRAGQTLFDSALSKYIRWAFYLSAIFIIGVVITPFEFKATGNIHMYMGACLFIMQILISGWLCLFFQLNLLNSALLIAELLGGIIAWIYLTPTHGFLIQGQLLFQLAFGLLMIRMLYVFESAHKIGSKKSS